MDLDGSNLEELVTGLPAAGVYPTIARAPVCLDGIDNDGDGLIDFPADLGCRRADSDREDPQCDDDIDNDGDGQIDWDGGAGGGTPDANCGTPFKNTEKAASGCGLGQELVFLLPLLYVVRRRRGATH